MRGIVALTGFALACTACSPPSVADPAESSRAMGSTPSVAGVDEPGGEFKRGACIDLKDDRNFVAGACNDSAYMVVQVAKTPSQCVRDADRIFFRQVPDSSGYAYCADINWTGGRCLRVTEERAETVRCESPAALRLAKVITRGDAVADCSFGGYGHPSRNFTVCVEPAT
jgi:hypothetical protein